MDWIYGCPICNDALTNQRCCDKCWGDLLLARDKLRNITIKYEALLDNRKDIKETIKLTKQLRDQLIKNGILKE